MGTMLEEVFTVLFHRGVNGSSLNILQAEHRKYRSYMQNGMGYLEMQQQNGKSCTLIPGHCMTLKFTYTLRTDTGRVTIHV